jgi:hypothetical protein
MYAGLRLDAILHSGVKSKASYVLIPVSLTDIECSWARSGHQSEIELAL